MLDVTITQFVFGYLIYYINPYYAFLLILRLLNIQHYTIQGEKEQVFSILKKLNDHVYTTEVKKLNGKEFNCGWFYSLKAIGKIDVKWGNYESSINILTTKKFYKLICKDDLDLTETYTRQIINTASNKVDVYIKSGKYSSISYIKTTLDLSHIHPIGQQISILDDIMEIYNKLNRASIFIHGVSCAGKSKLGYLLAKQLGGNYCHTFNPNSPGDNIPLLLSDIDNSDGPLVIVMEEIENIIYSIHEPKKQENSEILTAVYNKSSWCTFLDDMFLYRGVILVLTSNKSKEEIDALDKSYLRDGRIHKSFCMLNKITVD